MTGTVEGGWIFVIAAYGATAAVLVSYGAWLFWRLRTGRGEGGPR